MDRTKRAITRRGFAAGAVFWAASAGSGQKAFAAMTPQDNTIDTHAHVFHRGLKLAPGRRYAPDYDAPLDLYLKQLDDNGMTNGVLVQPSFLGTDNSYLAESLKTAGGRLRGIAVIDAAISPEQIGVLDRASVVGIRLNLVGQPLPDLAAPEWKGLLANIKAAHWQIEIQRNAADLAVLVPKLLDHGLRIVLDHYALPDPKLGVADPAFAEILKLGASRNVWIKISAPYRNGGNGEAFAREAYPLLRNAYGLDRLLWGSDWPHTQFEASQTYAKNRHFLDELVTDPDERAKILASPKALFRF
ncbi:amidohydrolase family protein [Bradyrhizobium sp.]|uniref:amidohydrolase family protein n=1 Tax=Bradyrhizobium sp. TaxID=376 RepID=UPI001EB0C4FD|nr:amidohydrolase family protein [Bradyrhizobium sp.]MBV9980596.1 amidohydrolase family protein [Bradyrhizobium sp.]